MATIMNMPKLGLTMSEGTIVKWLRQEGERVEKGTAVVELTTDKSLIEHEAAQSGILAKILVAQGETASCGKAICIIAEENEDISSLLEQTEPPLESSNPAPAAELSPPTVHATPVAPDQVPVIKASPAAKKKAKSLGIDLSLVTGTGPQGRITEGDVAQYRPPVKATPVAAAIMAEKGIGPRKAPSSGERIRLDDLNGLCSSQEPLSPIQRQIATRMTASKQSVPHWYVRIQVDCTNLIAMRSRLLGGIERRYQVRLSYNHLLMKSLACALAAHPRCNISFHEDGLVFHPQVNIGLAVAVQEDLLVPVVKNVSSMTLGEIAVETSRLVEKARDGRLLPMDYESGTITLSNLGMYDIDSFIPIINPPESGIIGVGAMKDRPVVREGAVVVRPMMELVFSADHRCIHGALGAKFMETFKRLLENPEEALI